MIIKRIKHGGRMLTNVNKTKVKMKVLLDKNRHSNENDK
jgi:hypothetical protein